MWLERKIVHPAVDANSLCGNLELSIVQAPAIRYAMSSRVLKWYGSLMIALFKFAGSRQILILRFPDLSFDSTRKKVFIHGVASVTGFNTPACKILFISFLNASSNALALVGKVFVLAGC